MRKHSNSCRRRRILGCGHNNNIIVAVSFSAEGVSDV